MSSYNMETVLARVVVKPKNSVIKYKHLNNLFFNIKTGRVEEGSGSWVREKDICSWLEPLDEKYVMVTDDTMYIEFLHDVSNVKDGYCGTCEMIHEDYNFNRISDDYKGVWEIIKNDFKVLDTRKDIVETKTYLMVISIHSTYCSYVGDGDVYLGIEKVIKVNGSSFTETKLNKKEMDIYGIY